MAGNQDIFKLEADEVKQYRIRKLTPKECWRLMGFSDEDFEKAAAVNSNTQLYAQAGNSIVVNVLEAIFKNMISPKAEKEPEAKNIVEVFREKLMNSEKVQLYGSINSGNYMINIEDAVEILKQCAE
nr:MAG TPA: Cytosine specific methyltransferase [Caudoviricetes sp.]